MKMVFTSEEVEEILRKHLEEKLGVSSEAIGDVSFSARWDGLRGVAIFTSASLDIKTDAGVPQGPYRSNGR